MAVQKRLIHNASLEKEPGVVGVEVQNLETIAWRLSVSPGHQI